MMPGFEEMWFNKADVLRQDADEMVAKALRNAGWKHTSQTPGSVWMWECKLDGVVYRVSLEDAARTQEIFDRRGYFNQYPDELSD